MRDTPDRQLQLDFQRRAPESWNDCSDLAARASSAFSRRSAHFSWRTPRPDRRFLPTRSVAPLTSDGPHSLPRRRVNDAGFNASPEHLRSVKATASPLLACTGSGLPARFRRQPQPTACPNEHEDVHRLLQSIQARAHWPAIAFPAAPPLFTTRRCALRRSGGALPHRPFRCESQRRAGHGSRLSFLIWTSRSPLRPRYPGG